MIIGKEEISKYLPHRDPSIFVDSIEAHTFGKSITGSLFLNPEREFFKGHFPNNPIMPGVLIAEALAQTSGLLVALDAARESSAQDGAAKIPKIFYLASNNMKFTNVARAGDTLTLNCALVKSFGGLSQFSAEAICGRNKIATGSLVLAEAK